MVILRASNVNKTYGANTILEQVSLQLETGQKVGLIGANGAGKTTLCKILAGKLLPDSGEVWYAKEITLGYLTQENDFSSGSTVWQEALRVFHPLMAMEKQLRELEAAMGKVVDDQHKLAELMEAYGALSENFTQRGGFIYESRIRGVLHGLGFPAAAYDKAVDTLSGGQKTRLAIAKLLLQQPDILLLDEPTNHLDLDAITWLEGFLKDYPGAVVIISHDRYFLDQVVSTIWELANHKCTVYKGNYTAYARASESRRAQVLEAYLEQQKQVKQMEDYIRRAHAWGNHTQAASRAKMLARLDRLEKPRAPAKQIKFNFQADAKSSRAVICLDRLSKSYGENRLFSQLSLRVERGERLGIIGPNGTGKSTLLKIIAGEANQDNGDVFLGHKVSLGYYEQEHHNLRVDNTVLEEVWSARPLLDEVEVRSLLGRFLFNGDDVYKRIADLSGGEKNRVALAKLMLTNANCLLLDEPTNHLDLFAKEALEDALLAFDGTIVAVSHDRYFLNKVATRILELNRKGYRDYLGNYDDYLAKKTALTAMANQQEQASKQEAKKRRENRPAKQSKLRLKQLERLEAEITGLERETQTLEAKLCDPELYKDSAAAQEVTAAYETNKVKLQQLYEEWEALVEKME